MLSSQPGEVGPRRPDSAAIGAFSLMERMLLKSRLLCQGCDVEPGFVAPLRSSRKLIHLYAHSPCSNDRPIPDDVLLPGEPVALSARLRYNPRSTLALGCVDGRCFILDRERETTYPAELVPAPAFSDDSSVSSVCSFLGTDLLGVTPSNYCFYYKSGTDCRFCEILPTYHAHVEYTAAIKPVHTMCDAIRRAFDSEPRLRYLAVTSGNFAEYDATATRFADLMQLLMPRRITALKDVLATLMPPTDFRYIGALRDAGFTKVYFSLEVYRPDLFEIVCPGKASYGYDRILNALQTAVASFGIGNVYTNFVYGIQSLDHSLSSRSYCPERENDICRDAVSSMLDLGVVPVFTLYHYGGYNSIGAVSLDPYATDAFFRTWGVVLANSAVIPCDRVAALFSSTSLSNSLFNDGLLLARTST